MDTAGVIARLQAVRVGERVAFSLATGRVAIFHRLDGGWRPVDPAEVLQIAPEPIRRVRIGRAFMAEPVRRAPGFWRAHHTDANGRVSTN